jgi:hypothetical protein
VKSRTTISQFCTKNRQLALERLLRLGGEGEDKEMTPTGKLSLIVALLSLLSIFMLSGTASAQPAPVVTGTLHGVVATVPPDGQSYSVPGASLKASDDFGGSYNGVGRNTV